MNIIVSRQDGSFYTRPDTSIEREAKDFYMPDGIISVQAYSCYYTKVIKAGKAVSPKFASRYFDSTGACTLLYGLHTDGSRMPFIDGSTILAALTVSAVESPDYERIVSDICRISQYISIRIGDIIIFEKGEATLLHSGDTLRITSKSSINII